MVKPPGEWPPPKNEIEEIIEAAIAKSERTELGEDLLLRAEEGRERTRQLIELERLKQDSMGFRPPAMTPLTKQERVDDLVRMGVPSKAAAIRAGYYGNDWPAEPIKPISKESIPISWPITTTVAGTQTNEPKEKKPLPFDDPENMPKRSIRLEDE